MSQKCPTCNGARRVMKLGGMTGSCQTCKGNGFVKEENKTTQKTTRSKSRSE